MGQAKFVKGLNQAEEVNCYGPIPEEINFRKYRQVAIGEIEQAMGLRFQELVEVDTHVA